MCLYERILLDERGDGLQQRDFPFLETPPKKRRSVFSDKSLDPRECFYTTNTGIEDFEVAARGLKNITVQPSSPVSLPESLGRVG